AEEKIDLTVVGPELPLTLGIADLFESRGLKIFAPSKAAAQLEGSKAFAKEILQENGIPTAAFGTFTDVAAAKEYLARQKAPYVIKADGLAGGKGVIICQSRPEAEGAIDEILVRKAFGAAGNRLVIEEFLAGAGGDRGDARAHSQRNRDAASRRAQQARYRLPRRDLRRPDDHRNRAEGVGIQRPLRRPGMPADHDAAKERSDSAPGSGRRAQARSRRGRMARSFGGL